MVKDLWILSREHSKLESILNQEISFPKSLILCDEIQIQLFKSVLWQLYMSDYAVLSYNLTVFSHRNSFYYREYLFN